MQKRIKQIIHVTIWQKWGFFLARWVQTHECASLKEKSFFLRKVDYFYFILYLFMRGHVINFKHSSLAMTYNLLDHPLTSSVLKHLSVAVTSLHGESFSYSLTMGNYAHVSSSCLQQIKIILSVFLHFLMPPSKSPHITLGPYLQAFGKCGDQTTTSTYVSLAQT